MCVTCDTWVYSWATKQNQKFIVFKSNNFISYREHLYGLIDDKTFKTELTVFRIDKESELIQAEHRSELMPFIMR
jgi:U3 small nucleolar RNA-associated protein 20